MIRTPFRPRAARGAPGILSGPALTPLNLAVERLAAACPLAPVEELPLAEAVGLVLAERLVAEVRSHPVALRAGWAVAAGDTSGASPYGPVPIGSPPIWVVPGDRLPEGADAVLPPDAAVTLAGPPAALAEAAPGEGARRQGEDAVPGTVLAPAGTPLDALDVAVAREAGLATARVRRPYLRLLGDTAGGAAADLVRARARALGAVIRDDGDAALAIVLSGSAPPGFEPFFTGLALRPGEPIAGGLIEGRPVLVVPPRVETALAAALVLLPALIAAMSGGRAEPRAERGTLARKIASQVGLAEIALLSATEGGLEPTAVGDLSLAAMARATHFLLLGPESEGFPAGSTVDAVPLR
ncbi:MAG TPA: hypothetical protein VIL65_16780 [Beijerinckiaceae bacterium]